MKPNFKKMLATIGLLAVAVPTTLSVVACGEGPSEPQKIELSTELKNLDVAGDTTKENIIERVIANNKETTVKATDLTVKSFDAAQPGIEGKAVLEATADSKFTGSVNIKIVALEGKISLEAIINVKEFDGDYTRQDVDVITQVVKANPKVTENDIQVQKDNFNPATKENDGSATITATKESNFQGSVDLKLLKREDKKFLHRIIINRIVDGNIINNEQDVLNEMITRHKLQQGYIKIEDFHAATDKEFGSATIISTSSSEFKGKVKIVISKKNDTYPKLIEKLKAATDKSIEKLNAWKEFFTYKDEQFKEIYNNGLLVADLDGTNDRNVWEFMYWVIKNVTTELAAQGVTIDYTGLAHNQNTGKNKWDTENHTVEHTGTYEVKFWEGAGSHNIVLENFKMFYELNPDRTDYRP